MGRQEKNSRRISVKITGAGKQEKYILNDVRTVQELGLPSQTLNYEELAKSFPHLQGLPVDAYCQKTREGGNSDPVAAKTRLGWCVYGKNSTSENSMEQLHIHAVESISNTELHNSMRKFFAVEDAVISKQIESEDDKRARGILEATTVRKGNRMETGLLWRKDNVYFPDSHQMALNRLKGLEKRLGKDPALRKKVNELIESFEHKEYVRKITPQELESSNRHQRWYLPIGVVTNPKKPNKIRMVWDAAAKVNGVSFNDMLLKGPDLLVPLVDVLIRFREGKIAVCSDIREMFLRILIRDADKMSQCFLWRNSPEDKVQVYVINVAMFGATSSPCTAQYAKNKNALDFVEQYPRAVQAIVKNHYVDDFLDSVNSVEDAVQLVKQVQHIHAAGGFEFGKILSNSPEVLDCLGETNPSSSKSLTVDKEVVHERVLGVVWVPSADHFTFDQAEPQADFKGYYGAPTKRQVLRTIMKLYDPLGFIAHFVVHGKILMQEIWRSGTNWDEPIAEHIQELWNIAAMMGSRLLQSICAACTVNIKQRFLWTDSATVLAWLRSDSRRYHQFVSFRVGEILSLTSVTEWHYVPSKLNVADDATKWNSGPSFDPNSRWFQGPLFLRKPQEDWPKELVDKCREVEAASEEVNFVAVHRVIEEVIDVERFSSWHRMLRTMVYVHRAVDIWKHIREKNKRCSEINRNEFVRAEIALWRQAQWKEYEEEINELKKGCSVPKRSSLYSLSPVLDEQGVIRMEILSSSVPTRK
ncbi:uncharacterized protein LOC134210471 [Armigeres subalbatus]|uniref:uncharacterized protein LOC134210471 n=1 Tax=Armigeres subalbatus TaxID=124917 RepID=UPI002ED5971F